MLVRQAAPIRSPSEFTSVQLNNWKIYELQLILKLPTNPDNNGYSIDGSEVFPSSRSNQLETSLKWKGTQKTRWKWKIALDSIYVVTKLSTFPINITFVLYLIYSSFSFLTHLHIHIQQYSSVYLFINLYI